MVTARGLVEGSARSWEYVTFAPDERPRSLQLYGTDPVAMGEAVRRLVDDDHVDHLDLNFGCPAPKVTRHGGGAGVPARPALLAAIVRAAVTAAGDVPVTMKFRRGVDESVLTFLDAGRVAEDEGCAAVALHARTAEQLYSGNADWSAIGELKAAVTIPVLGNGDIWEATDALAMMRATGCDGVVIGRGCLGRPWLFGELVDVFDGRPPPAPPRLGTVIEVMRDHAAALAQLFGEARALRDFRKHAGWYLTGYPVGSNYRRRIQQISTLAELDDRLAELDPTTALAPDAHPLRRGTTRGPRRVTLPDGWLDRRDDPTPPSSLADALVSGG
jgi:nifR3 family TIM-barrel protein